MEKRPLIPATDPRGVVGGSGGCGSGARGFPGCQGPSPGIRQAQTDGGSRAGTSAADDGAGNVSGADAAPDVGFAESSVRD